MKKRLPVSFLLAIVFIGIFILGTIQISHAQDTVFVSDSVPQKKSLIQKVENWYDNHMNYATITSLMIIESSFIPFPSEVVIPPAAYVACKPESDLHIVLVVLFGTLGAIIGALINYYLSFWLGRKIIYAFADSRLGKLCLLSSQKVEKAENYFREKGNISTFIGRLLPGIRQLISIPAGLSKMKIGSFILFTALGAGIWNIALAVLGYLAHGQKNLIDQYSKEISQIVIVLFCVVVLFFIVRYIYRKIKSRK